ncbi:hypothetical protein ANTRET_LOCUS2969 [Anthophora retusa]
MESDTATDWSSTRKGSLETPMPRKFRKDSYQTEGATLNWVMCALCITSWAVSGLLIYRGLGLETRIANLEARYQLQETPDLLIQRLKREVQQQLEAHQFSMESNVLRNKRDISKCNCPPEWIGEGRKYACKEREIFVLGLEQLRLSDKGPCDLENFDLEECLRERESGLSFLKGRLLHLVREEDLPEELAA